MNEQVIQCLKSYYNGHGLTYHDVIDDEYAVFIDEYAEVIVMAKGRKVSVFDGCAVTQKDIKGFERASLNYLSDHNFDPSMKIRFDMAQVAMTGKNTAMAKVHHDVGGRQSDKKMSIDLPTDMEGNPVNVGDKVMLPDTHGHEVCEVTKLTACKDADPGIRWKVELDMKTWWHNPASLHVVV